MEDVTNQSNVPVLCGGTLSGQDHNKSCPVVLILNKKKKKGTKKIIHQ